MSENQEKTKVDKPTFYDSTGAPICAHCYVRDEKGNVYHVNSSFQVIPQEGGAVLMLSNLLESGEVTILSPMEVLEMKRAKDKKRLVRGPGRPAKAEKPSEGKLPQKEDLFPVSLEIVLAAIPDKALANELRKRGYTLTASKPVLVCL